MRRNPFLDDGEVDDDFENTKTKVEDMIQDIEDWYMDHGGDFDMGFIYSVKQQLLEKNFLSPKQIESIENIFFNVVMRENYADAYEGDLW